MWTQACLIIRKVQKSEILTWYTLVIQNEVTLFLAILSNVRYFFYLRLILPGLCNLKLGRLMLQLLWFYSLHSTRISVPFLISSCNSSADLYTFHFRLSLRTRTIRPVQAAVVSLLMSRTKFCKCTNFHLIFYYKFLHRPLFYVLKFYISIFYFAAEAGNHCEDLFYSSKSE